MVRLKYIKDKDLIYTMDIESRVKYYLNDMKKEPIQDIDKKYVIGDHQSFQPNVLKILNFETLFQQLNCAGHPSFKNYGITLFSILKKFVQKNPKFSQYMFFFRWGDEHRNEDQFGNDINVAYFTKTRQINNKTGVLLNFNYNRHWGNIPHVKDNDKPFQDKMNKIVWRGSTTGEQNDEFSFKNNRLLCVQKYHNHKKCDIGFTNVVQRVDIPNQYLKRSLKISEQLNFKYILSIEGNDVASGLKWQLYSNSVVFMRKPKVVSWAMEDKLIPYEHYIPVKDDFSNIEEQIRFADENQLTCLSIIKNANEFIEQFLDTKKEELIQFMVIKKYFECNHFI